MIKEKLTGESLSKLHPTLGDPGSPRHVQVRSAVEELISRLLKVFLEHPETKTSVSPNNIFVAWDTGQCRCILIDSGPAPMHDYSRFDFEEYWTVVIPRKIAQYRKAGYL
ncbi:MAG: hypothetical protein HY815_21205 [Candidatus Riflebacteria bacterium]|nr:hypothetical protein [Candidatus Riflebacteria bacterium]